MSCSTDWLLGPLSVNRCPAIPCDSDYQCQSGQCSYLVCSERLDDGTICTHITELSIVQPTNRCDGVKCGTDSNCLNLNCDDGTCRAANYVDVEDVIVVVNTQDSDGTSSGSTSSGTGTSSGGTSSGTGTTASSYCSNNANASTGRCNGIPCTTASNCVSGFCESNVCVASLSVDEDDSSGVSGGAIAGIIVAAFVVGAGIAALIYFMKGKKGNGGRGEKYKIPDDATRVEDIRMGNSSVDLERSVSMRSDISGLSEFEKQRMRRKSLNASIISSKGLPVAPDMKI